MQDNTRTKYGTCKQISKCSRYIDDIIVFNSGDIFYQIKTDIYPEELILNKENYSDKKASFLDIQIEVIDKKFVTQLYDKRIYFQFHIVYFPFLCGNIPNRQSYGVFTSQIIRYSRVCSKYEDFLEACKILIRKLLKQGYEIYILKRQFNKLPIRYLNYNKLNNIIISGVFQEPPS